MDMLTIFLRLGAALVLGSAIGIERQWYQKMAGLRTNALVALGAAGYVVFSAMVDKGDPTRIAGQIVSGIGFLGAGVILREGTNVHGLNTAATLWCSAMVGTLAGGGYLPQSALAASFIVATNILLRPLVRRLNRRVLMPADAETHYAVQVTCRGAEEALSDRIGRAYELSPGEFTNKHELRFTPGLRTASFHRSLERWRRRQ